MGEPRATGLSLTGVTVRRSAATLVEAASLRVAPGSLVVVLGANGAGKTTLLRAAAGLIAPDAGSVAIDGDDPRTLSPVTRARRIAYVPQARPLAWPLSVRDVVALGRFAYGAVPSRLDEADAAAVAEALDDCGLTELADRRVDTLSGGEAARVHVARALAARAPTLIADEPAAALDLAHAHAVMGRIKAFTRAGGAALVTHHDPAAAAAVADVLVWMRTGLVVAAGSPEDTLTAETVHDIYGVRARVRREDGAWSVSLSPPQ